MSTADGCCWKTKMLFFPLYISLILFGETSFQPGLLVKSEDDFVVLQTFLLKVDIFLLIPFSFLYISSIF